MQYKELNVLNNNHLIHKLYQKDYRTNYCKPIIKIEPSPFLMLYSHTYSGKYLTLL